MKRKPPVKSIALSRGGQLSRREFGAGIAAGGLALATVRQALATGSRAPYAADIQSLGWWMRRTTGPTMADLTPYYQQTLGLPLVRAWGNDLVLLWAGEDLIFEVKTDDYPSRPQADSSTASMIPVFRVHDLERWRVRMEDLGQTPLQRRASRWGETLFYRGPDHLVTGFEYRAERSPFEPDRRGLAAWRTGPFRLGTLPPLPDGLHYLSRAIRHVADVPSMFRYYRDAVGLAHLGREGESQIFALGGESVLEIAPGGSRIAQPGDRSELPDSFVLRTHNLDEQLAALSKRGAILKGDTIVKEETTRLHFIADPEGWILGVEERRKIRDRYIDDVEADRRWRARGNDGAPAETR